MKTAICTTTINPPTEALRKYAAIAQERGWDLFIAGDRKTPHDAYREFDGYAEPEWQAQRDPELSDLIGWNCIQRRNFAILAALDAGADRIALVDDDNIPLDGWGDLVVVGETVQVEVREPEGPVFDPLYGMEYWHRGFPIQLLDKRTTTRLPDEARRVLAQADLWMGTPDVDAVGHIAFAPWIERGGTGTAWLRDGQGLFAGSVTGPFNSQNTWLHRSAFPDYFLFPGVGRMDDIFASYTLQHAWPDCVVYGPMSVEQQRNPHDPADDLEAELIGYRHALEVATDSCALDRILPDNARRSWARWWEIV